MIRRLGRAPLLAVACLCCLVAVACAGSDGEQLSGEPVASKSTTEPSSTGAASSATTDTSPSTDSTPATTTAPTGTNATTASSSDSTASTGTNATTGTDAATDSTPATTTAPTGTNATTGTTPATTTAPTGTDATTASSSDSTASTGTNATTGTDAATDSTPATTTAPTGTNATTGTTPATTTAPTGTDATTASSSDSTASTGTNATTGTDAATDSTPATTTAPTGTNATTTTPTTTDATATPTSPGGIEVSPWPSDPRTASDREWRVRIEASWRHDTDAFTQGLETDGGIIYESTGLYGESRLRALEGPVELRSVALDPEVFGEGLTLVGDEIIQLSWREGRALRWDRDTFEPRGEFRYDDEGWGICWDEGRSRLLMSDGTSTLTHRNRDFAVVATTTILRDNNPVTRVNELECVDGLVVANIWLTDEIIVIDPDSGEVLVSIDAASLAAEAGISAGERHAVLNGIAYIGDGEWILGGKNWPLQFLVTLSLN